MRGDYSMMFKHFISSQGWYDIIINYRDLFGMTGISLLADKGVVVERDHFIRYCKAAVNMLYKNARVDMRYEQFGWKDNDTSFLYALNLYTEQNVVPAAGSNELMLRSKDYNVGPSPSASLKVWRENIERLFAKGAEAQAASMCAGFGAPLMRLMEKNEGGAILHCVTPDSASGKTWGMLGSISIYGRKWGLSSKSDDTKVSKGLTLAAIGNLPIFNDELTLKDPEAIKTFIRSFTEGRDRMRANRSGELQHQAATWQTIMLSASNQSIHDVLQENNSPDAMTWRVVEIPYELPREIRLSQGDKFRHLVEANSGIAGDIYIRALTSPAGRQWATEKLEEVKEWLWENGSFEPKHRYWIRALTGMWVGGWIAKDCDLVSFEVERVMKWLVEQLRVHMKKNERPWAVDTISEYLRTKWRSGVLTMPGPYVPKAPPVMVVDRPGQELLVRYEIEGQRYIIAQEPLRRWLIGREQSYKALVKDLLGRGVIKRPSAQMTLAAGTSNPGIPCYCIEVDGKHPLIADIAAQELKE